MFNFRRVFSFGANSAPSKKQRISAGKLKSFSDDEDGIATVWAMFWLIICFALSGLAIDVTNAWKVHAILQSTADSSALAGAYELDISEEDKDYIAVQVNGFANTYATLNMHVERYGDVLDDADIQLGYWDNVAHKFTLIGGTDEVIPEADYFDGPANAVRAITRQNSTQNTGVGTFFLRFVGFNEFTVATNAIANIFLSRCEYDGLMAAGAINLTMGQEFYDEFCIHSEIGIKAAQGNYVSPNSVVSAPSYDLCGQNETKCSEDTDANIGFQENFIEQSLFTEVEEETQGGGSETAGNIWMAGKVDGYIASLLGTGTEAFNYTPPYISTSSSSDVVKINLTGNSTINDALDVGGFVKGATYEITCRGGKDVKLSPADDETWDTISHVVIVGKGCDFVFDPTIRYFDLVIATDSTSRSSISSTEGLTLGYYDKCDDYTVLPGDLVPNVNYYGGAVTLLTQGSVHFASKFHSYDMEIIAAHDVHLAGRPLKDSGGNTYAVVGDDVETTGINVHVGSTIKTGGDIHVSRSHEFNGCLGRISENLFDPNYSWRLVW